MVIVIVNVRCSGIGNCNVLFIVVYILLNYY